MTRRPRPPRPPISPRTYLWPDVESAVRKSRRRVVKRSGLWWKIRPTGLFQPCTTWHIAMDLR